MSRTALCPGTFDPFTNGHLDVIRRARELFDRVVVGVLDNPEKSHPLFSAEERVAMIREAVTSLDGVQVLSFRGLAVDAARRQGAIAIVKGLRGVADLEGELQQASMNRHLAPGLVTLFLPAAEPHARLASSILKDVASHGGDVSDFVPAGVARRLKEKFS